MPDHMNYYHDDMEAYFADKANIFLYQKPDDYLILGEQVAPYIQEHGYQGKVPARTIIAGARDIPHDWTLKIPGEHNRYDAGIAVAAARALGIDESALKEGVESFGGVPGRLELVRDIRGIKVYNDTTATVPEATIAALHALGSEERNIILIMGGADKGLDMRELLQEVSKCCKKVVLLAGSGTQRVASQLTDAAVYEEFAPAVRDAYQAAAPGDIILLSPAFASFGMFKNEYDRGEQFNALIQALPE